MHFHHLWTTNPDGTGQTVFYGNMAGGIAMLDAKPIPGTVKVVASFSPGHGRPEHLGPITVVDPRFGPDDPRGARTVSKTGDWKDPYAFSENCFLVANPKGLFVMDGDGNVEMIHQLSESERAQFSVTSRGRSSPGSASRSSRRAWISLRQPGGSSLRTCITAATWRASSAAR